MALTAYLDDSGTDGDNPFLVVGGLVATAEQWDRFGQELEQLDSELGAPPFHAKTFEKARHGHGFYASWSQSKREDYLNRFLDIIGRRCFKAFATSLEKAAYRDIIQPHETLRQYFYSQFVFSAVNCVHIVEEWRDEKYPRESLLFVFDRGNKNEGQLKEVAARIKGPDRLIEDIVPGDDAKLSPLRAADLVAFEWCAESRSAANPNPTRKYSRYALLRLDELPHEWIRVDKDSLLRRIGMLIDDGTFKVLRE